MNMISTGAFLNEMDASNKQSTVAEKFAAVWEKKNAKAARAGGVSLMALSLAACGSSSTTTTSSTSTSTTTTTTPTNQAFDLTAGFDAFTGGAGDDTFTSSKDGNYSIDDTLVGGAGTDTLYLRAEDVADGAVTLSGIEVVDIRTVAGGSTLTLTNAQDVETVVHNGGIGALTVSGAGAGTGVEVKNQSDTDATTLNFKSGVLSGSADTVKVALNGNTGSFTLTANDATGEIETLNISGSTANTGTATLAGDLLDATKVTFTNTADVITAGAITSKTIDASGATGGVTVVLGTADVTYTGGAGKDVVLAGTTYDKSDTITGGAGTADTFGVGDAPGAKDMSGVSGFEVLRVTANSLSIDADNIGDINTFEIVKANDVDDLTITDIKNGATFNITQTGDTGTGELGALDFDLKDNTASDTMTLNFTVIDGTNDELAITTLDSSEKLDTATITTAGVDGGKVTVTEYDLGASKLIVTGSTNFKITAIDGNDHADGELDVIDASGLAATFEAVLTEADNALVIEGSSTKANTVTLSGSGDTFIGGSAVDTITDAAGVDTVTFGAGVDVWIDNHYLTGAAATDIIKDFATGTGGDVIKIDEQALDASGALIAATTVTLVNLDDGAGVNGATPTAAKVQDVGGQETIGTDVNIVVITGTTAANIGAAVDLLETGGSRALTVHADAADVDDGFVLVWSDGTNGFVSIVSSNTETTTDTDFEATDLVGQNLVQLNGITSIADGDFVDANFAFA